MISETWEDMMRQLEPAYNQLKDIMDNGPKVIAVLRTFNGKCRVRIEEDWSRTYNGDQYYSADYSNLDQRCEWAAEQLDSWKSANRISHQEWIFSDRSQAEKFLTLFTLKWVE